MNVNKVNQIIKDKNDQLEYAATRTASSIIDQIAQKQHEIALANDRIVELRKELSDLEIVQLDEKQILGKE